MLIRECTPADHAAVVAVFAECHPFRVITEAVLRDWDERELPEQRRRAWVAEAGGDVVGYARTELDLESAEPRVTPTSVLVAPAHRRRGIGSALYDAVLEHQNAIGTVEARTRLFEDEARVFAEKRGYTARRTERISRVDPRTIPPVPPVPAGITLRSLAEVPDLRAVYDLDCTVSRDVPMDGGFDPLPFEHWIGEFVRSPLVDADCTTIAYDGDTPVALTFVEAAGSRMFSGLAGTLPSHRGKGLAKLVKTVALSRAAEKGVTAAYTNNDATNAPMLAVNTWLGYELDTEQLVMTRKA